ncbi:MAG: septum formation initiator family protein [Pacificimonas sp.]
MAASSSFRAHFDAYVRPVAGVGVCALAVAFFGWHAMMGETGILALGGYKAEQSRLEVDAAKTAATRADLENRIALMGDKAEADYAEELVRRELGLVRDDEIIVRLPE